MLNIIKKIFRKKPIHIEVGRCGLIVSTESSIESGINDRFNKKVVIYESVEVNGNIIRWGKVLEEIPYTEEEVRNLIKVKKIPIIEKRMGKNMEFKEGSPFGEVIE